MQNQKSNSFGWGHLKQKVKKQKILYYCIYTALFLIASALVFSFFYLNNKSFVWVGSSKDGLAQHLNCLVYYSQYLRNIAHNIFINHSFDIPTWDFAIGYGADIFTTMNFITVGDILNLFSIFFSEDKIPAFFHFLAIFRLYLAGITFSMFCFKMNRSFKMTMLSAFVYLFCGYTVFALPRHPFFINPMIYLPLLLLASEKILRKEKPYLFVIIVAISLINNFYFFFMMCLMDIIYIAIRFFTLYHTDYVKQALYQIKIFLIYGILGIMIGCIVFLPVLFRFLSDGRGGMEVLVENLYPARFYSRILPSFMIMESPGYWTYLSYGPVGVLGLFYLFTKRKESTGLKIGVLLFTMFLLIPFAGHIFNGFSYMTNRWVFGYSFLIAFSLCYSLPYFLKTGVKQLLSVIVLSMVYLILCLFFSDIGWKSICISFGPLFLLLFVQAVNCFRIKQLSFVRYFPIPLLFVFVFLNIYITARLLYAPSQGNYIAEYLPHGEELKTLHNTAGTAVKKLNDSTFFRYSEPAKGKTYYLNSNLNTGLSSPNYFFSFSNAQSKEFYNDLNINNGVVLYLQPLDSRAQLNTLASVKYYVIADGQENLVPYGYRLKTIKDKFKIYENEYALPLGYTYDSYITDNEYKKLDVLSKQEVMMQSIVLDQKNNFVPENKEPVFENQTMDYTLSLDKNIEQKGNSFYVKKGKSEITLKFPEVRQAELYLSFDNLTYIPEKPVKKNIPFTNRKNLEKRYPVKSKDTAVSVESGVKNTQTLRTPEHSYYNPMKKNYTYHLGYNDQSRSTITISFKKKGVYTFDDIRVQSQHMDQYVKEVQNRKQEVLENIKMDTNEIQGTIQLSKDKILCLSIPYTKGWSAEVDGKHVEILDGNDMFMAIPIEKGSHSVHLYYETPGMKLGFLIGGTGILCLLGIICYNKKKKIS